MNKTGCILALWITLIFVVFVRFFGQLSYCISVYFNKWNPNLNSFSSNCAKVKKCLTNSGSVIIWISLRRVVRIACLSYRRRIILSKSKIEWLSSSFTQETDAYIKLCWCYIICGMESCQLMSCTVFYLFSCITRFQLDPIWRKVKCTKCALVELD